MFTFYHIRFLEWINNKTVTFHPMKQQFTRIAKSNSAQDIWLHNPVGLPDRQVDEIKPIGYR